MKKKFLSGLLIGAFVFGIGSVDIQSASAAYALAKERIQKTKDKVDKTKDKFDSVRDRLDGDSSSRPEPPKDANGNPIAPPDRNSDNSGVKNKFDKAKDGYDDAKKLLKKS